MKPGFYKIKGFVPTAERGDVVRGLVLARVSFSYRETFTAFCEFETMQKLPRAMELTEAINYFLALFRCPEFVPVTLSLCGPLPEDEHGTFSTAEQVEKILDGIDRLETDVPPGWWETSVGKKFGAERLWQIRAAL